MNPRAVVAEDEELLRKQLCDLLASVWPELEIVAVAENGLQAIRALEKHNPDVVFLDIQMPELGGLQVAEHASGKCHVVFVTAYDQYAIAAFEDGAVDYVLKPLSTPRLLTTVQRVKQRLSGDAAILTGLLKQISATPSRDRQYLRWINTSQGEDVHLITIEEVRYFQSDTKYTRVVATRREGLIRKSIKELVEELDPGNFWQIHRATIVNLNAISSVGRDINGHVILRLKECKDLLQVSQPYAHLFRQM